MRVKKTITKQQVKCIIEKYRIRIGPYTIREDGLIDVNGNVKICNTNLKRLPLKFKHVYGNFIIHSNKLIDLKGCPQYVAGDFNCYNNELTTLLGCPEEIGGDFCCHENKLINLIGSPDVVNGNYSCFSNHLVSLNGAPAKIKGSCYLHTNEGLSSLIGGPKVVGGSLFICGNSLNDLVGLPTYIGNVLSFDNDVKLNLDNKNCEVKTIEIQIQEPNVPNFKKSLPKAVLANQKFLPIVFKYARYLNFYNDDGSFNEIEFSDIIQDIKEGLR